MGHMFYMEASSTFGLKAQYYLSHQLLCGW